MAIKVYDQFAGKISSIDINKLEYDIGYDLPKFYKDFLSKNNGGRIKPNFFKTIHNEVESSIHFFYGVTQQKIYDIQDCYDRWKQREEPKEYLPIAIDNYGNYIIVDLAFNYGCILFWSHDNPEFRPIEISKDFGSFLKSLCEVTVYHSDLYNAICLQDIKYFEKKIAEGEHIDDIRDEFNQAPVVMAALRNKIKLIKFFRENGSKMDKALFSAASNGHYESVRYLLSVGLDPNERDKEQNNDTALIQAAFGSHLDIVKILIEAGADINARDEHGQSVLRKAYWSDNQELISYLENLGATT